MGGFGTSQNGVSMEYPDFGVYGPDQTLLVPVLNRAYLQHILALYWLEPVKTGYFMVHTLNPMITGISRI
jgi:hypothetical protein